MREAEIILLCVRWYLRYSLSYRDLEEIMLERNLHVDHTTIYRSRATVRTTRRTLTVRRREAYEALEAARQRVQTEEFVQLYDQRAGIECTHAQGVHRMGLRRSRYIGEPRTHLQHVATATAIIVC